MRSVCHVTGHQNIIITSYTSDSLSQFASFRFDYEISLNLYFIYKVDLKDTSRFGCRNKKLSALSAKIDVNNPNLDWE